MSQLRPYFPDDFVGYYEPFLGGGAVFFDTGHRATGRLVVADLNDELINVWTVIRDQAREFLAALQAYDGKHSEDAYYDIRDGEAPKDAVERAARFLYLNQTAWNGLWRVNRWGRFNVPWGARPFRGMIEHELLAVSELLADVDIRLTC